MPYDMAKAYFERLRSSSDAYEPDRPLLRNIRRVLQHHEPPNRVLGKVSQFSRDDRTHEELAWGRTSVVWTQGSRILQHWSFPPEHEEIRAAFWAYFEESGTLQQGSGSEADLRPSMAQNLLVEESTSVFGSYGRAFKSKKDTRSLSFAPNMKRNNGYRSCSDELIRAVCIIFRSFARIISENGSEWCIHIPFLTRRAWALYPVGFALEREAIPEGSPWFSPQTYIDNVFFTLTAPLKAIAPMGMAFQMRSTSLGKVLVYQDDHPHPSVNINTFSGLRNGEKVIHVEPYSSPSQVIFTVDTRLLMINCYAYGYASSDSSSPTFLPLSHPSSNGMLFETASKGSASSAIEMDPLPHSLTQKEEKDANRSSQWLLDDTPVPTSWRDSRPEQVGRDVEPIDLLNTIHAPLIDLQEDDEEEIVGPEYWLQRLASIPVDQNVADEWTSIRMIGFNEEEEGGVAGCFAIVLPMVGAYRVIQIVWESQIPFIPRSTLTAAPDALLSPATSVVSVEALRPHVHDLLVLRPDRTLELLSGNQVYSIGLVRDGSEVSRFLRVVWSGEGSRDHPIGESVAVDALIQGLGPIVRVKLVDGEYHDISLQFTPRNALTNDILATLRYALPSPDYSSLRRRQLQLWVSRAMPSRIEEELDCIWTALFEVMGCDNTSFYNTDAFKPKNPFDILAYSSSHSRFSDDPILEDFRRPHPQAPELSPVIPSPFVEPVMLSLHLLGQAIRVDTNRASDLDHILRGILRLAKYIAPAWADYWSRLRPDVPESWARSNDVHTPRGLPTIPPDFILHCLQGAPWIDLPSIASIFGYQSDGGHGPCLQPAFSKIDDLRVFFGLIRQNSRVRDVAMAEALCQAMVDRSWQLEALDNLPTSLATPIREVLRICQISPKMSYQLETYKLIERPDLFEFAGGSSAAYEVPVSEGNRSFNSVGDIIDQATRACVGIIKSDETTGSLARDLFTEIRWADDRRLEEVQLMLQCSRIPVIKIQYTLPPSEHEKENANLVLRISERTLSLSPGRALFTYGCLFAATPEAYVIPRIELAVRVMPMNSVIILESNKLTLETKTWAEFHNGVATGLRLAPQASSVEGSWIQYAKPSELTAEHAGFLLGLGLNGHLRHVDTWNTFSYLSPKHDQTSMAILLGLAASNVGTSSHYITRLIAVHTPALLPIRTVDINVSLLTQSAGLVALGLVFLGTGDRRLADVALQEISRNDITVPTNGSDNREAYTLSAAFAFGMIMVGQGEKSHSAADQLWLDHFRLLIHGERRATVQTENPKSFDLNITAPGACLALAMLYLKSGRTDVADIVSVPTSRIAINTVPPNLLLLRTLSKSLILWDDIQPTAEWVNAQYTPMKTTSVIRGSAVDTPTANALDIANYNVVAGACLAIALKFAGSASADAWRVVVYYYDVMVRGVYANARTYEHSIRRQATRDAINVLSCAMAIIMAGSGDLDCLQRFRYAHGKYTAPNKFGMHMANHMAMGLLFLGGGRYTLGTSDAAICALLIAFYPRFPLFGYDNRFHLQALRHLWVLAVEPRCLIVRDVDTRKVVLLPVKLKVREGYGRVGSLQLLAPTLTPDFDLIRSLRVDSPRYWPFFIDYEQIPRFKDAFLHNPTLWVKRRRGYLGYYEDPHCTRSSFVRSSGGAAGDIVCLETPELLDSSEQSAQDFNEFMTSFSEDDRMTAFAERLCSDSTQSRERRNAENETRLRLERAWSTYCQAALIDCFAADKPAMLPTYMELHAIRAHTPGGSNTLSSSMIDMAALQTWYRQASMMRTPLIRSQIIKSVFLKSASKLHALRQNTKFMGHLQDYVNGRGLQEEDRNARRMAGRQLAFYLTQSETPSASYLAILKKLYVSTVQEGVSKGWSPDSLRSALMMVMKETVAASMGMDWQWQAISDVFMCWREG